MGEFLRENWLWILAPVVLLVIALLAVIFMTEQGNDGAFVYNIF